MQYNFLCSYVHSADEVYTAFEREATHFICEAFYYHASVRVIDTHRFCACRNLGNDINDVPEASAFSPFAIEIGVVDGLYSVSVVNISPQVFQLIGISSDAVLLEDQLAFAQKL